MTRRLKQDGATAMSHWSTILNAEQLQEHFMRYRYNDPHWHDTRRDWWMSRTAAQLDAERAGAWCCNDGESYMLARSLLAINAETQGA